MPGIPESRDVTLKIPDEIMKAVGLCERDLLVELSCWLFDKGQLELWQAARLAGLERHPFKIELQMRNIAIYRPTAEDLLMELKHLESIGAGT